MGNVSRCGCAGRNLSVGQEVRVTKVAGRNVGQETTGKVIAIYKGTGCTGRDFEQVTVETADGRVLHEDYYVKSQGSDYHVHDFQGVGVKVGAVEVEQLVAKG